jgi:hypothetical protein
VAVATKERRGGGGGVSGNPFFKNFKKKFLKETCFLFWKKIFFK